jgi:hypothetical protein
VNMDKTDRRMNRALRLTPASDRARYEEEWRRDLSDSRAAGADPDQVSRGALGMALQLRLRHAGNLLLGKSGPWRALSAWVVLAAVAVLALLLGNIILLLGLIVAALAIVALTRAGVHSHWSHALLVASLIAGTVSAAFVWWVLGVRIDAADSFTQEPPAASWGGTALVVFALSAVGVVVSAVIAATRESSRRAR